ncbi:hypothetical protein [Rhabdochlamydiaceae symbiont of Dictyostelium giganteum]|uniref:hypothetical protein n=1 Tax=Rhabdochlamydiaceae symbiont of Dictyostelium giganteum TaxID=3342349 RepID=UPI00384E15C3
MTIFHGLSHLPPACRDFASLIMKLHPYTEEKKQYKKDFEEFFVKMFHPNSHLELEDMAHQWTVSLYAIQASYTSLSSVEILLKRIFDHTMEKHPLPLIEAARKTSFYQGSSYSRWQKFAKIQIPQLGASIFKSSITKITLTALYFLGVQKIASLLFSSLIPHLYDWNPHFVKGVRVLLTSGKIPLYGALALGALYGIEKISSVVFLSNKPYLKAAFQGIERGSKFLSAKVPLPLSWVWIQSQKWGHYLDHTFQARQKMYIMTEKTKARNVWDKIIRKYANVSFADH